jgi:pimeloyl-ACP methyl ester carboxylesterase
MVHGFLGGSAQWDGQIKAMSDAREVVALDLPGFGKNAHLPAINSISRFAEWVIAELQRRGVDQFDLLGHSMGGMIAQEIAHRIPDRIGTLVLYATGAIGVLPGRFETIAQSKARAVSDGATVTARRIAATWFLNGTLSAAYEGCAAIAEQAGLDALNAGLDAMEGWSGEAVLARLTPDTLLIWGDRDRTYPWSQIETLWTSIPKTSLSVIPNCAHAVHLENPEGFNHVLLTYLGRARA